MDLGIGDAGRGEGGGRGRRSWLIGMYGSLYWGPVRYGAYISPLFERDADLVAGF
jgi:hypothetical protein